MNKNNQNTNDALRQRPQNGKKPNIFKKHPRFVFREQKNQKRFKKIGETRLTKSRRSIKIHKRSSEAPLGGRNEGRGDLENDTGSDIRRNPDERTTVNSNESETPEGPGGLEGFKRKEIRGIKHKSLILAQDERWRRA